jgi:hypothetical protein
MADRFTLFDRLRSILPTGAPIHLDDAAALDWLKGELEVVDLRSKPQSARKGGKKGTRGRHHGHLSESKIEGVVLHQTAGPVGQWLNVPVRRAPPLRHWIPRAAVLPSS